MEAVDATNKTGKELVELLVQQRLLYLQLRELAMQQTSLVDGNDPEMLLKVLASRQRLIDKLKKISRKLEPVRADWQRISRTLSVDQRQEVQELVDSVQEILGDILSRDEKDSQKLSENKQQVAQQIRGMATGKRMNHVYGQSWRTWFIPIESI